MKSFLRAIMMFITVFSTGLIVLCLKKDSNNIRIEDLRKAYDGLDIQEIEENMEAGIR